MRKWIFWSALALGLLIIGICCWGVQEVISYQMSQAQQRAGIYTFTIASSDQQRSVCIQSSEGVWGRLACLADSIGADIGDRRALYDLEAQQDMALWAFALLWVSAGGLILSVIGVGGVIWTLGQNRAMVKAALNANEISDKNFRHTMRPRLVLKGAVEIGLYRDEHTPERITAKARIENRGRSPAELVCAHLELGRSPLIDGHNLHLKKFADGAARHDAWSIGAVTILDGKTETLYADHEPFELDRSSTKLPLIRAIFCVTYKGPLGDEYYYTACAVDFSANAVSSLPGVSDYEVIESRKTRGTLCMS